MQKIEVIGFLGSDAEVKEGKNGQFLTLRVASNDYINGENKTSWFSVTSFNERDLKKAPYLKKGSMIYVHGVESVRIYTTQNGTAEVGRDIRADVVEFGPSSKSGDTQTTSDAVSVTPRVNTSVEIPTPDCGTVRPTMPPTMAEASISNDGEEDLPF